MFRKLSLALVLAALAAGPAWAQFGGDAVKKPAGKINTAGTVRLSGASPAPNTKIIANGLEILGAKGPKALLANAQGQKAKSNAASLLDGSVKGITLNEVLVAGKAKPVNPNNSQKRIIAVLIGLAKDPNAPAAKQSIVPGPVPLKDQIQQRRQKLGASVRKGLADKLNSLNK